MEVDELRLGNTNETDSKRKVRWRAEIGRKAMRIHSQLTWKLSAPMQEHWGCQASPLVKEEAWPSPTSHSGYCAYLRPQVLSSSVLPTPTSALKPTGANAWAQVLVTTGCEGTQTGRNLRDPEAREANSLKDAAAHTEGQWLTLALPPFCSQGEWDLIPEPTCVPRYLASANFAHLDNQVLPTSLRIKCGTQPAVHREHWLLYHHRCYHNCYFCYWVNSKSHRGGLNLDLHLCLKGMASWCVLGSLNPRIQSPYLPPSQILPSFLTHLLVWLSHEPSLQAASPGRSQNPPTA